MVGFLWVGSFVVVVVKLLGFCCGPLDVVEILRGGFLVWWSFRGWDWFSLLW